MVEFYCYSFSCIAIALEVGYKCFVLVQKLLPICSKTQFIPCTATLSWTASTRLGGWLHAGAEEALIGPGGITILQFALI